MRSEEEIRKKLKMLTRDMEILKKNEGWCGLLVMEGWMLALKWVLEE